MPLPKPHSGETEDEFMGRCMADAAIKEFPKHKQQVAVCMSQWADKEKKDMAIEIEPRAAISSHSTATSKEDWKGPANEARLRADEPAAYYRKAFAWVDPEADPETKAAYKFIHHEVSGDGTVGAANLKGCSAGIAVLNGGRGGADIPSGDRQGVWNHLARHLRDGDQEPPALRSLAREMEIERRIFTGEMRLSGGNEPVIEGYAAVFNHLSEDLGGFREQVAPGAFLKAIRGNKDIYALFNHDRNFVLGRTGNETLRLSEDEMGLKMEVRPPNTTAARDILEVIRRGDVSGASFSFAVVRDDWSEPDSKQRTVRTLREVRLFDVGPVVFPAYKDTLVSARALEEAQIRVQNAYLHPEELSAPEVNGSPAPASEPQKGSDHPERKVRIKSLDELVREYAQVATALSIGYAGDRKAAFSRVKAPEENKG